MTTMKLLHLEKEKKIWFLKRKKLKMKTTIQ